MNGGTPHHMGMYPKTKCSDTWYYSDEQFDTMNKRRVSESVTTHGGDSHHHDTITSKTHATKLNKVTFCLGDKPMRELGWCKQM